MSEKIDATFNGLQSDLATLAKFVMIYETDIRYLHTQPNFEKKYNKAFSLFKKELQTHIRYAKKEEIPENIDQSNKITLYFTKSDAQVIDLCRHLRNSFSHANMVRTNERLIITDIFRGRITSNGYLPFDNINSFIVEIVKTVENVEKKRK